MLIFNKLFLLISLFGERDSSIVCSTKKILKYNVTDKWKTSTCCNIFIVLQIQIHILCPVSLAFSLSLISQYLSLHLLLSLTLSVLSTQQARYLKGKELGLHVDMSRGPIPNVNSLPLSPDFLGPTCLEKALIDIQTL